jgi:hypothetical protein
VAIQRNQQRAPRTEAAVLHSEIEQLPDLQGYLKLASSPVWRRVMITTLSVR